MASLQLSKELEKNMDEFPEVDWSKVAEEAIRVKAFEIKLTKSKELQKALLEALASKSKLTEKEASDLGFKVSEGFSKELKENDLI